MNDIDIYLSQEFTSFSEGMNRLNKRKSELKLTLKDFYDKIQSELKQVEESAKKLVADFEAWKNAGTWKSKSEPKTEPVEGNTS